MKRIFLSAALIVCSIQLAAAQMTVLLDNNLRVSSGVNISAGNWQAGTVAKPQDADATYIAFYNLKSTQKQQLGQYDFYYSLEIVPQFKMNYSNCATRPTLANILKALFGTTNGAVIVVNAQVQYRWTTGIQVSFLPSGSGLIAAGVGASSAAPASPGYGCYFDTTLRPTFPLLQYGGGGKDDMYDDFVIKFSVIGGTAENLNLVANLMSLFGDVSAAAGWSVISGGLTGTVGKNVQQASQTFETALQQTGTIQNQVSVGYTLKANDGTSDSRIVISIPDLFGTAQNDGNLVIYVRRTGSIILSNSNLIVDLTTVFDNAELPDRLCNPAALAAGSCNSTSTDSLRFALAKLLGQIDSKLTTSSANPVQKLIDVTDSARKGEVYSMCKGLRTVARESLHLSTLDEMMIRWRARLSQNSECISYV
jgi:hypothetical protein